MMEQGLLDVTGRVNPDKEKTVDEAFAMIKALSDRLREKYLLDV